LTTGTVFTSIIDIGHRQSSPPPPPPTGRIPGRLVFSWYQAYEYTYSVYNPPLGDATSIAAYKHDITDAQTTGVDGFIILYINRVDMYPSMYNLFEAAKELAAANPTKPPFWLWFAPNCPSTGNVAGTFPGTSRNWIEYFLSTFANHPNYYHYKGNAAIGSFFGVSASSDQNDWINLVFSPLAAQGINLFFTPSIGTDAGTINAITTDGTHFNSWAQTYIGSLNYWTGNIPSIDVSGTNYIAGINTANARDQVLNLSGAVYFSINTSPSAGYYFEHFGGEGPRDEWLNAINMTPAPAFIIETTWNDMTESYTSPVDIPNVPTVKTGYGAVDLLLKPHRGYSELRKYYAQWYTTGAQPTITKDLLIYFYRTSPVANCTASDNISAVPDVIFVTTELTAPATLMVSTGGQITNLSLPAGINFSRVAFSQGVQSFALIRGGVTIASVTGENIGTQNNLETTTGFAYAA
jgi:Glycosyl hydrolase family 71